MKESMAHLKLIILFIFITLANCSGKNPVSSQNLPINENQKEQNLNSAEPTAAEQNTNTYKSQNIQITEIWKGQVGKFSVNWTSKDISFSPVASPNLTYSLAPIFENRFNNQFIKIKKELPKETLCDNRLRDSISLSIKSIVGTVVSVEMIFSESASITSYGELAYITFDTKNLDNTKLKNLFAGYLEKSQNNLYLSASAKLSDYFAENDIFEALVKSFSNDSKETSLDRKTFLSIINDNSNKPQLVSVKIGIGKKGEDLFLTRDSFRSFVFDKIEDQKIVVRLQVYENTGKPYEFHWLDIKLPISASLQPQLEKAEKFQNSFLVNSSEKKFKEMETIFTFERLLK